MRKFDDWSLAFDYCRECDKPIIVMVCGNKYKLYPSGKATQIGDTAK